MTVEELIKELSKYPLEEEVVILDCDLVDFYPIAEIRHINSFKHSGTKIVGISE